MQKRQSARPQRGGALHGGRTSDGFIALPAHLRHRNSVKAFSHRLEVLSGAASDRLTSTLANSLCSSVARAPSDGRDAVKVHHQKALCETALSLSEQPFEHSDGCPSW